MWGDTKLMINLQPELTTSRTILPLIDENSTGELETIKRHWKVLANVRNLIDELEALDSDFEVIGTFENEDLPPEGEFFLSLTVKGDGGPTVTQMGFENGRLYVLLSKYSRSSELATLELGEKTLPACIASCA